MKNEPKKFDDGKLCFSLIPPDVLRDLAAVYTHGATKYGPFNWCSGNGIAESRLFDALFRHLNAHLLGEEVDPESGLTHLSHALCNLTFLLHNQNAGLGVKDLPWRGKFDYRTFGCAVEEPARGLEWDTEKEKA